MKFWSKAKNIFLSLFFAETNGDSSDKDLSLTSNTTPDVGEVKPRTLAISIPVEQRIDKTGMQSSRDLPFNNALPPYIEFLDILEHLVLTTPDYSQAVKRTVNLGNTGYSVDFEGLGKAQIEKSRDEINKFSSHIGRYKTGMDNFVDLLFRQILIKGAISIEVVPSEKLDRVERIVVVPVKTIRFKYENYEYIPYQTGVMEGEVYLNTNQYIYSPLIQAENSPYAIPPFLSAMDTTFIQKDSIKNVKSIINKFGLLGFLFAQKTMPFNDGLTDKEYEDKLVEELEKLAESFRQNFGSGAAVSYDDVSVTHNSISTDTRGAIDLFNLVEQQIASGLDIDPALLGRTYSTTETYAGVVYHAFVSSLDNIRKLIKRTLEKIYFMHLVMLGFPVKRVKVSFNPSKSLKPKEDIESEGIKIDNVLKKMNAGIIDLDTAARELGYEKATGTPQPIKQTGLAGKKYKQESGLPDSKCCENVSFVELGWSAEEEQAYQKLEDEFIKSMMDSYRKSVDELIGLTTKIDTTKDNAVELILKAIEKKLGQEFPENIKADYKKAISDSWDLGQDFTNGNNNPASNNINATALNFFNTAMKFDIGKQFTVEKGYFEQAVKDALETGKIQDVVDALEKQLLGNIKDNALVDKIDYIVRGHILRARNSSRVLRMEEVGITRVEIVAILDQKTSHICRALNGKTVEIKTLTTYTKEFFADDPTRPSFWESRRNPTEEQLKSLKPETLSGDEITKALGHKMPPYHPRCRTSVVASFYQESKTIQEAEQYAIDKGLAKQASYKDVPLYVANEVNKALLDMKNMFGVNYDEITISDLMPNNVMTSNPKTLSISKTYFTDKGFNDLSSINEFMTKLSSKVMDGKNYCNGKSLYDIIIHEFGHRLTSEKYNTISKGMSKEEKDNLVDNNFDTSYYSSNPGQNAIKGKERLAEFFVLYIRGITMDSKFVNEFNKYSIVELK